MVKSDPLSESNPYPGRSFLFPIDEIGDFTLVDSKEMWNQNICLCFNKRSTGRLRKKNLFCLQFKCFYSLMPLQVVLQYKEIAFLKFHLLILTFCEPILEKQMQDVLVSWVLVKQGAFGEQLPIKHNDLILWFNFYTWRGKS